MDDAAAAEPQQKAGKHHSSSSRRGKKEKPFLIICLLRQKISASVYTRQADGRFDRMASLWRLASVAKYVCECEIRTYSSFWMSMVFLVPLATGVISPAERAASAEVSEVAAAVSVWLMAVPSSQRHNRSY